MKKILIPIFVFISFAIQAQELPGAAVINESQNLELSDMEDYNLGKITLGANSKTRGPSRWYDIVDAVYKSFGGGINVYANDSYNTLWADSTMLAPYGNPVTYSSIWIKSVASYFDPVDPRYNDVLQYPGETAISNSDPYSIDSLFIPFLYYRNAAKANIVDTLIVSVVYGDGLGSGNDLDIRYYGPTTNTATNHGTDTLRVLHGFMDLNPASSNQYGYLASSSANVRTIRVPLTAASLNDTILSGTASGFNYVQLPINLNVPAGNKVAASMVFKSGDTWTPNVDTVYISGSRSTPNFNNIRFVAFEEINGGFQQYTKGVWTQTGLMRNDTSGWQNRHIPCYAFNNTSYEHQWFQWKVSCNACWTVGTDDFSTSISALTIYPNPAKSSTTLTFNVTETLHNAKIQLLNLNGAVLATTDLGHLENGTMVKKEISTSEIAAGMYFIQLQAEEGTRTEKIVIE